MSARAHAARTQVRLTLAQSRADRGRMVALGLAVAIGAAFVVAAMGLTASSDRAVLDAVASQYSSAAAVVTGPATNPEALITAADRIGATGATAVVDRGGEVDLSPVGQPDGSTRTVQLLAITAPGPLRWERVLSGRLPRNDDEAVVSGPSGLSIGATVDARQVLVGDIRPGAQAALVAHPLTVVGTLDVASDLSRGVGALLYVTPERADQLGAVARQVRVAAGAPAATPGTVRNELASRADTRALTVSSGVDTARAVARNYAGGTAGVTAGLLVFVVIALLVAGLVIANTFAVVLAQRVRELALLRCVGASARQVARGVVGEALLLGLVASVLGAAIGAGLTVVVSLVLGRTSTAVPLGAVVIPVHALLLAVAAGTVVCVLASLVPARAATRVPPLAALRPLAPINATTRTGRTRLVVGAGLGTVSLLAMLAAAQARDLGVAVAAGVITFGAVVVLAQQLAAPLAGMLGRFAAPLGGMAATLAGAEVRRHPRRTAASMLVLLVGITLTAAVVVGAASTRATADDQLGSAYPIDVTVRAGSNELSAAFGSSVDDVGGASAVALVTTSSVHVGDREVDALGIDPSEGIRVTRSGAGLRLPGPGEIVMPYPLADQLGVTDGTEVELTGTTDRVALQVAIGATGGDPEAAVVTSSSLAAVGPVSVTQAWVRLADGLDDERSEQALAGIARLADTDSPGAVVTAHVAARRGLDSILDTLLVVVTALLGVSVLIALIGLANTLALSAVERRRESAVLRALGTTRTQLGATVLWEAVLVSTVAAVLGVLLGVGYGLVGVRAGLGALHVVLPWGQLGVLVVGASVAGMAAALLPAWRTTRGAVVAMLAEDR